MYSGRYCVHVRIENGKGRLSTKGSEVHCISGEHMPVRHCRTGHARTWPDQAPNQLPRSVPLVLHCAIRLSGKQQRSGREGGGVEEKEREGE